MKFVTRLVALLTAACATTTPPAPAVPVTPAPPAADGTISFVNENVVPMTREAGVLRDKVVIVRNGRIEKDGNALALVGNLTIRNVTKPVKLNVEYGGTIVDPYGNTKAGFEINGKINRKDFGLTWSAVTEAGGVVVGDDVRLHLNVELARM